MANPLIERLEALPATTIDRHEPASAERFATMERTSFAVYRGGTTANCGVRYWERINCEKGEANAGLNIRARVTCHRSRGSEGHIQGSYKGTNGDLFVFAAPTGIDQGYGMNGRLTVSRLAALSLADDSLNGERASAR